MGFFGQAYFKAKYFAAELLHGVETVVSEILGGGGVVRKKKKDDEKPIVYPEKHPWIHFPEIAKIQEIATVTLEVADAVIETVAKVAEKRTVQNKVDETKQAEKEFRAYLKSQEMKWRKEYAQLIRLEYERREQEYEDAQIAMLLFEM
jgi:hypothetical protein